MKFLKIKEGVCICIDKVEALEEIDQLHTRIYMTNGGVYEAMFPYTSLITLLEIEEEKPVEQGNTELLHSLNEIAKTQGFFAG